MEQNEKSTNKWIVRPQAREDASLQLVCLPQAGGNAWTYRQWAERLPDEIELLAIQYPGHGDRLGEEPHREFDRLLSGVTKYLAPELNRPYALFGHSMGALLAFETARALQAMNVAPAKHVFLSGYNAPEALSIPDGGTPVHEMSDSQLLDRIEALDCTPREILEDKEMRVLLLRQIRADSSVCDSHVLHDRTPLDSPVTVLGGTDDPRTSESGLKAWQEFTSGAFDVRWFRGNHGFLLAEEERVHKMLVDVLLHGNGLARLEEQEARDKQRRDTLNQREALETEVK
jgi:medium-chain acyl-[acyl-carrier-protein] hydrolase